MKRNGLNQTKLLIELSPLESLKKVQDTLDNGPLNTPAMQDLKWKIQNFPNNQILREVIYSNESTLYMGLDDSVNADSESAEVESTDKSKQREKVVKIIFFIISLALVYAIHEILPPFWVLDEILNLVVEHCYSQSGINEYLDKMLSKFRI